MVERTTINSSYETIYDSESAHPEEGYRYRDPVGIWWKQDGQLIQKYKHKKT